jgi:hypothetical protein
MTKQTIYDLVLEYAIASAAEAGDIARLPEALRTVAIICSVQGVIDNGGLQYLFEADFPGKPDYRLFVEAYRAIGADDAAAVLETAVALFPFDSPHQHVRKRNEFMDGFKDEDGDAVNSPFESLTDKLCGNKEVWEKLRQYVQENASAFRAASQPRG